MDLIHVSFIQIYVIVRVSLAVLRGKHFNVGHYVQTVQPNSSFLLQVLTEYDKVSCIAEAIQLKHPDTIFE